MTGPTTRQVMVAAIVLLAVGALGASLAGRAGASFMRDLEEVQPALARTAPVIDDTPRPRLARRVFLVVVDGLRWDRSFELDFLDELRRRGVDLEAQSHYPTWSRPNYVAILTGVPPTASGVRTNHHSTPVQLDSLMDRAHAAGLTVGTATDYDVLPRLFLRRRSAPPEAARIALDIDTEAEAVGDELDGPVARAVGAPNADLASPFDDARYAPWPGGFSEAGSALVAGTTELVILLVGAVDAAGHTRGAASPEYRAAALAADDALARVLSRVDLTQDAIIVVSDHGHTDRGGHGGLEPEVTSVPLILAGAGLQPGTEVHDARLIDVAPTVAALLGMPAPGHGFGRTLVEVLATDIAAPLRVYDALRVVQATTVFASSVAAARADRQAHRTARLALVAGAALLAIALGGWLARRRALRFDLRLLLVSVPAFFIVYAGLLALLGQRFSPSLLPAQGHLAATLLRYGVAAVVVQLAASMWALRRERRFADRLAAANGVAGVALLLTMVPAGVIWAVFPPPYVTLPGPTWLVLIPAVQVAVACAALNVALTLFVEIGVFVATAGRLTDRRASRAAGWGEHALDGPVQRLDDDEARSPAPAPASRVGSPHR